MKTITGVPESITRAQYLDLIRAVGFEPEHLSELRFEHQGIYADVVRQKETDDGWVDRIESACSHCKQGGRVVETVFIPVRG